MHQKFGCDNNWREKASGGIKKTNSRLAADIRQMSEIPRNQIINFVKRSQRNVERIGNKFAVKNAA